MKLIEKLRKYEVELCLISVGVIYVALVIAICATADAANEVEITSYFEETSIVKAVEVTTSSKIEEEVEITTEEETTTEEENQDTTEEATEEVLEEPETTTIQETETKEETTTVKTYNGIAEGDTIYGTATYYCSCEICCGKSDGITASGEKVRDGIVACNWLPLGTILQIDGVTYTVADRGGSGLDAVGRLDVYTSEGHQAALELGRTAITIVIVSFP